MNAPEKGIEWKPWILVKWRPKDILFPDLCDFNKVVLVQVQQKNYEHSVVSCSATRRIWLYISLPIPVLSYASKEWTVNLSRYIIKEALKFAMYTLHSLLLHAEEDSGLYAQNSCKDEKLHSLLLCWENEV